MSEPIINDVTDTALWVATYRAEESKRPDALFRDPFAARLAGERGREIAKKMKGSESTRWSVTIRTYVIDAFVKNLISDGIDVVLNLGAGLDTRPYRLDLPPFLRWVEIDHPKIINLKEECLANEIPKCKLERIKLDLSDREARLKVFKEISVEGRKILVLTEGVIPYLTISDVSSLAEDLHSQTHFQYWIADYFAPEVLRYIMKGRRSKAMKNAPFQFNPPDWFSFFSQLGWKAKEIKYLSKESMRLGRKVPMPLLAKFLRLFMSKKARRKFEKFTAYVLLERQP